MKENVTAALAAASVLLGAAAALASFALHRAKPWQGRARAISAWLGRLNARWSGSRYGRSLQRRLAQAGAGPGAGAEAILLLQELGFAAGLLAGLALAAGGLLPAAGAALLAPLGALLPWLRLRDRARRRQAELARALPFTLDLLTLSVEAGMDFSGALGKVVERGRAGPLKDELQRVLQQLKVGLTREEALRAFAARVELPAVTAFTRAIVQADRMGTGLSRALRLQAQQLRTERSLRAERLAAEAPVKMLLPLVLFIFPTVFLILFGPLLFTLLHGEGGR